MRLKSRHQARPVIPTASMADIAFLLIVFFMVTITFEKDKTQVALPKTELRYEIPVTARGTTYTSSDLAVCSFGLDPGRVFAGADGVCTITADNSGFSAQAGGTVSTFPPAITCIARY